MITTEQYFNYLETCAINHKKVGHTEAEKHFFRVDIEELGNAFKSKANWPLIAAINPYITSTGQFANRRHQWQGSFLVLTQVKDKGDFNARQTGENLCMEIAHDIEAKMVNDRKKWEAGENPGFVLEGLDSDGFSYQLVPNEYTSFCGVLVGFRWNAPSQFFDADKWNNENEYTI